MVLQVSISMRHSHIGKTLIHGCKCNPQTWLMLEFDFSVDSTLFLSSFFYCYTSTHNPNASLFIGMLGLYFKSNISNKWYDILKLRSKQGLLIVCQCTTPNVIHMGIYMRQLNVFACQWLQYNRLLQTVLFELKSHGETIIKIKWNKTLSSAVLRQ